MFECLRSTVPSGGAEGLCSQAAAGCYERPSLNCVVHENIPEEVKAFHPAYWCEPAAVCLCMNAVFEGLHLQTARIVDSITCLAKADELQAWLMRSALHSGCVPYLTSRVKQSEDRARHAHRPGQLYLDESKAFYKSSEQRGAAQRESAELPEPLEHGAPLASRKRYSNLHYGAVLSAR